jgi:hypothetical protein
MKEPTIREHQEHRDLQDLLVHQVLLAHPEAQVVLEGLVPMTQEVTTQVRYSLFVKHTMATIPRPPRNLY